jgi:hypothetical protein
MPGVSATFWKVGAWGKVLVRQYCMAERADLLGIGGTRANVGFLRPGRRA